MSETGEVIDPKVKPRSKVLVADDEQEIATAIEDWLSDSFEVTIALNGKTTMQKAIWHRPAVILMDVGMPDMGAHELVRLLQGTPQTQDISIIVMTAKNGDDSTLRILKAERNVFGFINKPFKPSELIKMIGLVLGGARTFAPESSNPSPETKGAASPPPRPPGGHLEVTLGGAVPAAPPSPGLSPEEVMARRAVDQSATSGGAGRPAPSSLPEHGFQGGLAAETSRSFLRRGLGKAARFIAGLLVLGVALFAVAEWSCRWAEEALGAKFFVPPIYPASRVNSFLPYQWNPTNTNPIFWDDGRVVYQLNRWGLRGPDFPLVAPEGVTRILLLGGTFVFGPGQGEDETVSQRMEALLNQGRPGAFQVINAGLWALSPQEQWAYMKGQGFNFKPQTILWLCENRAPGMPSTEGLRWLGEERWLVNDLLGRSRFIQLLVHRKIRGSGDPVPKTEDPLFQEAEKMTREMNIRLSYWILPRRDHRVPGRTAFEKVFPLWESPSAAFSAEVADRLVRVLEKKTE